MSNAEDYSYLKAMMPATTDNKFQAKTWNYMDSIESSYTNGQCSFDLSTFANSKNAMIWSTGFIVFPLMIVMSCAAGGVGLNRSDYAVALKACYSNLINSVQVVLGDKTLNTSTPNIFLYNTLKQLAEGSVQSERTKGHLGLYIDDAEAFAYNPTGSGPATATYTSWKLKNGNGLLCNFWKPTNDCYINSNEAGGANLGRSENVGGRKRCDECASNVNMYTSLLNNNNSSAELRDYSYHSGPTSNDGVSDGAGIVAADTNYQVWYKNVCVRLSDILDLFGNVDMIKGGYFKINLNLNLGSCAVKVGGNVASNFGATPNRPAMLDGYLSTTDTSGGAATVVTTSQKVNLSARPLDNKIVAVFNGETTFQQGCPLLVNPSCINTVGGDALAGIASQTVIFGLHMGSVGASLPQYKQQNSLNIANHPLGKARLYLESVVLDEDSNLKLFDSIGAVKNIDFNDVTYNSIVNVPVNSTVSQQVGHSHKGAHTLIVIPKVADDDHGKTSAGVAPIGTNTALVPVTTGFSQWVSPFYPFNGAPLPLSKVQVTVDGTSLYPNMLDYTYQHYVENWNTWRTTNGNCSDGALQSGLLSKQQWEIFRTYIFTWPVEDNNVGKNVNLTFMNNSAVKASYDVFLVSSRTIKLNTMNGKIEEANF